ncbi:hypothetical protein DMN91_002818, partial [Ooceraea biroi]
MAGSEEVLRTILQELAELKVERQLERERHQASCSSGQKIGEELSDFGGELERLARYAYPECAYEVRDKIACAQFVSGIAGGFVRWTLQIEAQTSLKLAIERARALEQIHRENTTGRWNSELRGKEWKKSDSGKQERGTKFEGKSFKGKDQSKKGGDKRFKTGKECWQCGSAGHFRAVSFFVEGGKKLGFAELYEVGSAYHKRAPS